MKMCELTQSRRTVAKIPKLGAEKKPQATLSSSDEEIRGPHNLIQSQIKRHHPGRY